MTPAQQFGENLKRHRLSRELTQEALGKKAGIKKAHISLLETGQRSPSLRTAAALAKAMGITIDLLYKATQPPKKAA